MLRYILHFIVLGTFFFEPFCDVQAAQWLALDGTARFKVAYDELSTHLTPPGLLKILLRFTPRGEVERKVVAGEFKEKHYRSHLEQYEIDCAQQTALPGFIDIFGTSKERLKRLQGETQPAPILPGSALDIVAERLCPNLDGNTEDENKVVEPETIEEPGTSENAALNSDILQQIDNLRKKSISKDVTAETWKDLGNIYFDTDQTELAIKAYEHALALRPDDADTLNDQGAMYRQAGDYQKALANFEKACSIAPYNPESLYNSGYIYAFDLNNIPKALVIWHRYLELESNSEKARQVQSFIDRYGK